MDVQFCLISFQPGITRLWSCALMSLTGHSVMKKNKSWKLIFRDHLKKYCLKDVFVVICDKPWYWFTARKHLSSVYCNEQRPVQWHNTSRSLFFAYAFFSVSLFAAELLLGRYGNFSFLPRTHPMHQSSYSPLFFPPFSLFCLSVCHSLMLLPLCDSPDCQRLRSTPVIYFKPPSDICWAQVAFNSHLLQPTHLC